MILPNREQYIVRQFTRRASHYISDPPAEGEYLDWLSLIQHYGGPTRLLDFTHSFYTAAFFAVESASDDGAVWAVNSAKLEDRLLEVLQLRKGLSPAERERVRRETVNSVVGRTADRKLVLAVEPHRLNERLAAQQGLFVVPTVVTTPFQENLAAMFDKPLDILDAVKFEVTNAQALQMPNLQGVVIKMILPRKSHKEALDDLRDMNVTAATLFPGLDGFARSLHWYLSLFQENPEFMDRQLGGGDF